MGEVLERPLSPTPVTNAVRDAERERRLAELERSRNPSTLSIAGRPDIRMPDDFAKPGGLRIPDAFGPDGLMAYVDTHDLGYPIVRVVQLAPGTQMETGS